MGRYFFLLLISSFFSSVSFEVLASRIKVLYGQCAMCHGEQAEGNKELEAPALAGQDLWYLKEQLKYFKKGIRGKKAPDYSGGKMYAMARTLTAADTELISEYLAKLPPVKLSHTIRGNPAKGEEHYGLCSTCHGKQAEGNKTLHAPKLTGLNDWYLKAQIKKYKDGHRGYDAKNSPLAFGMAGMSKTLVNDEAIDNTIDYILALQGQRGTGEQSAKSKSK